MTTEGETINGTDPAPAPAVDTVTATATADPSTPATTAADSASNTATNTTASDTAGGATADNDNSKKRKIGDGENDDSVKVGNGSSDNTTNDDAGKDYSQRLSGTCICIDILSYLIKIIYKLQQTTKFTFSI